MSGIEVNKIIGAIFCAVLLVIAVSFLGKSLVQPKKHSSTIVTAAAPAPAPKAKKVIPVDPVGPLLASASVDSGKKQANKCTACHALQKGGKSKLGPPLWDIVGRKPGAMAGFRYSPGMAKMGGAWDYETLNRFLNKPKKFVPGTKMGFGGIPKAKDRANLIAFLRSLSDQPKPLP
jgi:cytochrome c